MTRSRFPLNVLAAVRPVPMLRQQSGKAWVNARGITIECMTLTTVHFSVHRNFHFTFTSRREEGKESEGNAVSLRERERECVCEREKGRDLFALQKPGRELS